MKFYLHVAVHSSRSRVGLLVLTCLGLVLGVSSATWAASTPRHALVFNSVPRVVALGQVQRIKPMAAKRRLNLAISLPLRNQAALDALLGQLYDPVSPSYHQFLSVEEFTRRFGPTQADYDAVVSWANANGLRVTHTAPNRHLIEVTATAAQVDRALHVSLGIYKHPTKSRTFYAPDRTPRVDLTIPILQITGLDDYARPQPRLKQGTRAQRSTAIARASGSGPDGAYLPSDMRAAYYGSGPLTGAGQTVAILAFGGYLKSDLQLFYASTGMTSTVPVNDVLVGGFDGRCLDVVDGTETCVDAEQILDIVNVIGMAPGLTQVLFYEGLSGPAILNRMATDNIAKVISCSWGSTDMGPATDAIFQEFKAQGQTFTSATGDSGAYDANTWMPPSLNPMILQVGGTTLTTSGAAGNWVSESAWAYSSGGFYAPAGYATPDYQTLSGVLTAANAGSTTYRNDPDVAAEGDFDNPTVNNGSFVLGYGGTSFAAPRWAGFIALANQQSVANGGSSLGFVNSSLYNVGIGSSYGTDFHDVSGGNNAHGGNAGFAAVSGYDLVTGWGSPQGVNLISALSGSTSTPGFVLAAYPPFLNLVRSASSQTALSIHGINGFASEVTLSASGLPAGVMSGFSPASTSGNSTLTFNVSPSATLGPATVTVSGASGGMSSSMPVRVFVGNAAQISVTQSLAFNNMVPLAVRNQLISVANAADSVPLTYVAGAYASSSGSCTGSVAWISLAQRSATLAGGASGEVSVTVTPAAATLAPGNYSAEICLTSNDPAHGQLALPVSLNVIPGPLVDNIFHNSFESGETNTGGFVTFMVGKPVDASQPGSSLDLASGDYHAYDPAHIDSINLYSDVANNNMLSAYWYNDELPRSVRNKVGAMVDANGDYEVLHSGDVVGRRAGVVFSNHVSGMPNWASGADGYLGVSFVNNQTGAINYGYIHLATTGSAGFPATVLEYGFDASGAAVSIP